MNINNYLGVILKKTFKWNKIERLQYKVINKLVKMNFCSPEFISCKALTLN